MSATTPIPLFPTYVELCELTFDDYQSLDAFLNANADWYLEHWQWAKSFLDYIGRNKSVHTYDRFRGEIERLLLWIFLEKKQPLDTLRKSDVLEYADF
jgi:hypothetical protein